MLETFYNTFGFFGAFMVAFIGFAMFICWIAGIAGISYSAEGEAQTWKLVLAVIFPLYPFLWLMYDINRERKMMQEKE